MLAYQHAYHAGNMADVHKHSLLAWALGYLTKKPKPLSYLETHAGRAVYDLSGPEAEKTGEAARGIALVKGAFASDHPYGKALARAQDTHGATAYPGSPAIADALLGPGNAITLAELHPREADALRAALPRATIRQEDGPAMALSVCPPTPRRGLVLIDPSYEIKSDYEAMPKLVMQLHRKWNVGVIVLWYPVLANGAHSGMQRALDALNIEGALHHQVSFPPAREGHGMIGSGLFVVNPPWGMADEAARIAGIIAAAV